MLDARAAYSLSETEHDRGFPVMCCFQVLQEGCGHDSISFGGTLNVQVGPHHVPVHPGGYLLHFLSAN